MPILIMALIGAATAIFDAGWLPTMNAIVFIAVCLAIILTVMTWYDYCGRRRK